MSKMYGSMLCPDCVEAKEYFEKINYKYDFVNITESMANLKEFLHLRDTRKEFEFKGRYDFSNIKNGLKKFIEISYKILMYLTIFSICCILIPMILITIYQFLIYFITLLTTILEVLIAIIRQIKI